MISRGVSNNVARGNNDAVKSFQSRVDECVELQRSSISPVMLTCTKCGETKPEDAFNKNKTTKTGRQHWCRECSISAQRATRMNTNPKNITPVNTITSVIANDLSKQLNMPPDAVTEAALKHYMVHVYSGDV